MVKYPGKESSRLEFKEKVPRGREIIKAAIAFSNALGGKIVIGVANDAEIVGISDKEAHEAMEWLDSCIYEACIPPIIPLIYQQRIDNKVLLIIEIAAGVNKPYYQKSEGLTKGTFIRIGRSTVQANADMIEELKWQSRGLSFDQLPLYHASREELNTAQIEQFLVQRRNGAKVKLSDEMLLSYRLISQEHDRVYPTAGGMLLFGENPQRHLTEAYILCSHFSGNEGRDAIASKAINGTLFEQFDAAYDFIVSRLNKSFKIEGKKRNEKLEIPPEAIREILMNAILHRNYHIHSPVKVAIYSDRIEIFSPGSFPGPIDLSNLESGITYVRNTVLAKVLWESQYIEKMGSGFIELFQSYRNYGLRAPIVKEGSNFIKCILPRGEEVVESKDESQQILNLFLVGEEISMADIIEKLNIPRTTAGRLLSGLIDGGKISRIGKGRGTRYRLK